MSVPLYMDHHVPDAVANGLRRLGIDVLTAAEDGAADWDDERLLERTTALGRVLYTQDRDFLVLADRWRKAGREFAGLAYAHQLNISVTQAIDGLELIAVTSDPQDVQSRVEYLPF